MKLVQRTNLDRIIREKLFLATDQNFSVGMATNYMFHSTFFWNLGCKKYVLA